MEISGMFSILGGLISSGIAIHILYRDPRNIVHQLFSFGLFSLALRELGSGMALLHPESINLSWWIKVSLIGEAFLPGSWLLFSLTFARSNYKELLAKWKILIFFSLVVPITLVTIGWSHLLIEPFGSPGEAPSEIFLGSTGFYFKLFLLFSYIIILANFEGTYRASSGIQRKQIKFMTLAGGAIFTFGIYNIAQTILYSSVKLDHLLVRSLTLILAEMVMLYSLIRNRLLNVNIFVSRYVFYNSVTVLVAGTYLFVVGFIVLGVERLGGRFLVPYIPLLVFALLSGLVLILLSEQMRWKAKVFINTHFYRNKHDYRLKWQEFTESVASKFSMKDLSSSAVFWLSETMGTSRAALWIYDPNLGSFEAAAITGFSYPVMNCSEKAKFIQYLRDHPVPQSLESMKKNESWGEISEELQNVFDVSSAAIVVPLFSNQQLHAFILLGERMSKDPYDFHDLELLKTAGDQIGGQIHRIRLTEDLAKAKEMEAFQTVSAFFIHDLKNLSSMLSLVVQNLPANIDNPEFRKDAFRVISESVGKMNQISGNLSLVTRNLVLNYTEADLNQMVDATLNELTHSIPASLVRNLHSIPPVLIDQEQIQKVLINLVLNASEAINKNGEIQIATGQTEGFVYLSVRDNGCGMTPEYISKSLFLPFQTTKSKGLGIGLFQCKKIIESHHGRIEVESEPGKGSTFKVMLPVKQAVGDRGQGTGGGA